MNHRKLCDGKRSAHQITFCRSSKIRRRRTRSGSSSGGRGSTGVILKVGAKKEIIWGRPNAQQGLPCEQGARMTSTSCLAAPEYEYVCALWYYLLRTDKQAGRKQQGQGLFGYGPALEAYGRRRNVCGGFSTLPVSLTYRTASCVGIASNGHPGPDGEETVAMQPLLLSLLSPKQSGTCGRAGWRCLRGMVADWQS